VDDLEARLGYEFKDMALKAQVLTHRSFRHENEGDPTPDNERLEFLGDAVLGFLVSRALYTAFPGKSEGELSKLRALLVSARKLAAKARALDLGAHLRLGRGEDKSGGRDKDSILSDAFESVVAGVYLDGGLDEASRLVERLYADEMPDLGSRQPLSDYKSYLQETLHARGRSEPRYEVVEEVGPDHRKLFHVAVTIDGCEAGRGHGASKKAAEQEAARAAVASLRAPEVAG